MRRSTLILAILIALFVGGATTADAQIPMPPASIATTDEAPASALSRLSTWIATQQRSLHRDLVRGMRVLAQTHALAAAWSLILASFLYGVFHAVGPGHGKAIIATYLATQPHRMSRGLWLSAAGSYAQGLTAIVLVYGVIVVAGWLPRDTQGVVTWSERASFALIVLIGSGLIWRAARALLASWRASTHRAAGHDDGHGHHHHHHEHHHEPGHAHDAHCGHVHAPTGTMIEQAVDWRSMLGIIAAIGLRPCTGAILVLILATALDLHAAGIAAVLAMSTGTAIALGALGAVVIKARGWAVSALAGGDRGGSLRVERLSHAIALIGGGLVALLGASLLSQSFGPAHPLGL
ncbi:MAG: nickel/cobalt transporter [Alphaproteobacteria bacterium]|nr:nickel/cobalt transporter [Alphaproteobacteria bacterium]